MIKQYFSLESWLNVLLYLGFMIIILLMAASLFFTINSASSIKKQSQELHNRQIYQTVTLLKLEQNLTLSFSQLSGYLITGVKSDENLFNDTLDKVVQGIEHSFTEEQNANGEGAEIISLVNQYQEQSRTVIHLSENRQKNYIGIFKAAELLNPLYLQFIGIMEQLIDEELDKGYELNIELLSSLVKTRSSWYRMVMSLRVYFTTRGELDFEQFNLYRQQNIEDIKQLSLLKETLGFEQLFIEELEDIHSSYLNHLPEVLTLYKNEKWRLDIFLLRTEIFPLMSNIHRRIREIVNHSENLTAVHMQSIEREIDEQVNLTKWVLLASITLGFCIILIVGRNISDIAQSLAKSKHEASEHLIKANERTLELEETSKELQHSLDVLNNTQQQLIESEKMAALGGLVAGVSHEINTPLGISITSSSFLHDALVDLEKLYKQENMSKEDFEKFIRNGLESTSIVNVNLSRAADLVRSFKQIAVDQSSEEYRSFDLDFYLHEIVLSLRPKLKKKSITVTKNCPESIMMNSYPGVYSQIMTNLILNSIVHGFENRDSGVISIDVIQFEQNNKAMIKIVYSDNGIGVSEEIKHKLFEPFYTTKRNKGGSGIGMSLVYNLVTQKLSGKISMESEYGKGIRFIITVPKDIPLYRA